MKYFVLVLINTLIFNNVSYSQDIDTTYIRYDHSIGTKELSNYYKVKYKEKQNIYSVEEFFRFTRKPELKASYTEDSNGKKQGAFISYDKEGVVKKQGTYQNDRKEGSWIYYEEGKLDRKVFYKNDSLHGKAYYYTDDGKELYEWNWDNGKSDGYNESKYPNGSTRFKATYVNGEREGTSQSFYKNGQLFVDSHYKNGKLEGSYESYYEGGALKGKGQYANGNEIGEWVWYRENGNVASKEVYNKNGKLKDLVFYDPDGSQVKSKKKDILQGVIDEKKQLSKTIKKHVRDNFEFPDSMYRKGFESKVYAVFVINKLGEPDRIEIESEGPEIFEEIARNIISDIPTQKPGVVHNLLVNVKYNIPLTFRIEN